MQNDIDVLSISRIAKNFDIFVNYCEDKKNDVGHTFHSNIASTDLYKNIKEMLQTIDYNEMYFCKSYSEKDHNKHMDQYQKHGYGKANTRMLRSEIAGVPVIEDFMQNYLKLKHGRAKINSQPPGNFFPVHIDYLAGWTKQNPGLAEQYTYPQFKRYILFLDNRSNGHFYSINNNLIDYVEGDIVEQHFYSWHATANGDLKNKILIAFEGIHND
jgi:hypothetical protein|tara:strand:+ start:198 stop:839 length:642 start_codon:yes stop_codon:yes gene_type:complete